MHAPPVAGSSIQDQDQDDHFMFDFLRRQSESMVGSAARTRTPPPNKNSGDQEKDSIKNILGVIDQVLASSTEYYSAG
jgi:hypothetical protein